MSETSDHVKEETVNLKIPKIKGLKLNSKIWFFVAIALAIVLVVVLLKAEFPHNVSKEVAANHLVDFLNKNSKVGVVTLANVSEDGNLYKVDVTFDGGSTSLYITKDGSFFIQQGIPIGAPGSEINTPKNSSEKVVVSIDDDAMEGDANAPVTIIEFSDFECPFCGQFYKNTYPQLLSEYIDTGKVKLVFRDFPLANLHHDAQKAAEAGECVRAQLGDKAYFEMHNLMFENQDSLDVDSLKNFASSFISEGLNQGEFNSCLDNGDFTGEVQKDLREGQQAGVQGTPTFFIDGRMLEGAVPFSEFQKVIDDELSKKSGTGNANTGTQVNVSINASA